MTNTTRDDMLTQVVNAIKYMSNKLQEESTDNAGNQTDVQQYRQKELQRLRRLHDDLHWFKSEY